MKNVSNGTGLALLAAAIVGCPFASILAANANAVGVAILFRAWSNGLVEARLGWIDCGSGQARWKGLGWRWQCM